MEEEFKIRMEDPEAKLGKLYIEEYLRSRGYTWETICNLPKEQAKQLMIEASTYAATKVAAVEARAHFVEGIHGATTPE